MYLYNLPFLKNTMYKKIKNNIAGIKFAAGLVVVILLLVFLRNAFAFGLLGQCERVVITDDIRVAYFEDNYMYIKIANKIFPHCNIDNKIWLTIKSIDNAEDFGIFWDNFLYKNRDSFECNDKEMKLIGNQFNTFNDFRRNILDIKHYRSNTNSYQCYDW